FRRTVATGDSAWREPTLPRTQWFRDSDSGTARNRPVEPRARTLGAGRRKRLAKGADPRARREAPLSACSEERHAPPRREPVASTASLLIPFDSILRVSHRQGIASGSSGAENEEEAT